MDRCLFFREFIIIIRGVRYVSLCVCCFIVCVLLKVGGLKGGGLSGCWWTDALDSRGGVSGSGFLFLFNWEHAIRLLKGDGSVYLEVSDRQANPPSAGNRYVNIFL